MGLIAFAAAHRTPVTVAAAIAVRLTLTLTLLRLLLTKLLLWLLIELAALSHEDAIIVLGVLEIILLHHTIASGSRVAGELQILLVDMRRRTPDLDVRARRVECPVVVVVVIVIVVLRPAAAPARTFHVCPRMCGPAATFKPAGQARPNIAALRLMPIRNVTYKSISLARNRAQYRSTRHFARCLELSLTKSGA